MSQDLRATSIALANTKVLGEAIRGALGVNGTGDAAHVLEHTAAQASLELESVEAIL